LRDYSTTGIQSRGLNWLENARVKLLKRMALNVLYVSLGVLMGLAWGVRPRETTLGIDPIPAVNADASVTVTLEENAVIVARPAQPNGTLFVYYPGGRVPAQSYEFMARALAGRGVTVAIPVMPLELAVLGANRASEVRANLEKNGLNVKRFVIGGHSLGGAMAARFASSHAVDGLVLMGAYSVDDLSAKSFAVLNLAAEHDGVAQIQSVRDGLSKLPSGTELVVIPGGVHSFFGRYGAQNGDGSPTTTRETFERELIRRLEAFLAGS
jgi:predicted esterase